MGDGPLLVADTSIIIDLFRADIVEAAFRVPFSLTVPDLLYERELAGYEGTHLVELDLQRHTVDAEGVLLAARCRESARLSLVDAFALALAKRLGAILLTGDRALRALAEREAVECHGLLWLFDMIEEAEALSARSLLAALERVAAHPRCRLPRDEVRNRLARYREAP
jgi:hypothetical protein